VIVDKYRNESAPQGLRGTVQDVLASNYQRSTDFPHFRRLEGLDNNFRTDPGWIAHGNRQKWWALSGGGHVAITYAGMM
jgi:hypothetical protein